MKTLVLAAAAALLIGGCDVRNAGESQNAVVPSATDAGDPEKIVAAAHSAYIGGDTQKIMDLYAPGAVVFDPSHSEPSADRAMQTKWAADFVLMKPADFVTHPQIQQLGPDAFVASGIAAFTADVGGNRSVLHTRYSQIFQRQADGRWLIVHEHMSMPPAESGGK